MSEPETNRLHWYALRTKSRHEKFVRDQLHKQGIEPLLPTVKRLSQWKDRKKEIEVPLFSGYCFVRFGNGESCRCRKWLAFSKSSAASDPEPIPEEEIESLKTLMTSVLPYDPHPYLHEGMKVEVVRGPLQGVHGLLLRERETASLSYRSATYSAGGGG